MLKKQAVLSGNSTAAETVSPNLGKRKHSKGDSTLIMRGNQPQFVRMSSKQARLFAFDIASDIRSYVESHKEEFEEWVSRGKK